MSFSLFDPKDKVAKITGSTRGLGEVAAPASDFITGQTIYIDGGWTAW